MIPIIEAGLKILDKVIPDPSARAEAQRKLIETQQAGHFKELEASMQVVVTEAQSEHWLTANWRPITMLSFVAIICNNYIIYPYLSLFWSQAPVLQIPPDMWELLKIGLGGYVVGRTVEKTMETYAGKK
jgi:hypothetical protein